MMRTTDGDGLSGPLEDPLIPQSHVPTPDATVGLPASMRIWRHSRRLRFLGHPLAYTIGTIVASILSIGTSLLAPSLLGPAAFGSFALLSSLFQYASRFDMGLSQLADRNLAGGVADYGHDGEILWANWAAGGLILLIIMPLAAWMASLTTALTSLDTALAVTGGGLAMIANAPVTIFRATAKVWEFTTVALTLQAGMTVPRLAGLVLAGVTGCFAVLTVWYTILVVVFARPGAEARPRPGRILALWGAALPLFLFNAAWLFYLTANRWIAASLTGPDELGFFAFGANLAFVGLGVISTIAQVFYPRLLARIVRSPAGACSFAVEVQATTMTAFLTLIALIAIAIGSDLIALVFPRYQDASAATIILAISCIPLGLATWFIPVSIAVSTTPKRDAARIFIPAYVALTGAMALGHWIAGTEGMAWGCVFGGIALILPVISHLKQNVPLRAATAVRIVLVQIILTLLVSGLALFMLPNPRSGWVSRAIADTTGGPPPGWQLRFEENFDHLPLWNPGTREGVWEPHYPWGGRNNPSNGEQQYYVDPRPGQEPPERAGLNPFAVENGTLLIQADRFAPEQRKDVEHPFSSGLLTSARSFSFTYGYVEMRARLPKGKGLWSAFWLAPADQTWPPEIDILEALGHDPHSYVMTAHRNALGFHSQAQFRAQTPDLTEDFHVYAVKWTAEEIIWYFDGRQVAAMPTPADTHKPMYMILNLAVGGNWPGSPDDSTPFPATFEIDYVRAYLPPGEKP